MANSHPSRRHSCVSPNLTPMMGPYLEHPKCHGETGTLLLQKPFSLGPASSTVAQRSSLVRDSGEGPGLEEQDQVKFAVVRETEAPAGCPGSHVIPLSPQCALFLMWAAGDTCVRFKLINHLHGCFLHVVLILNCPLTVPCQISRAQLESQRRAPGCHSVIFLSTS